MLVDNVGGGVVVFVVVPVGLLADLVSGCDGLWDASPKVRGFDPNILCDVVAVVVVAAPADEKVSEGFLKLDEDWKDVDGNVLVGWDGKPLDDVVEAAVAAADEEEENDDAGGVVLVAAADCDPVNPWNDPSKLEDVNVRLNDEDIDGEFSFD